MRSHWHSKVLSAILITLLALAALPVSPARAATDTYSTAGTFTWTAPAGVTSVTVEVWGGGGRGGSFGGGMGEAVGGGGGGGAYSSSVISVTAGNDYTVVVGAGSTTTAAGGQSYFINATTVMAVGGNSSNSGTGATGGAAASSVGTITRSGGNGANGSMAANYGGGGGSSAGTSANGVNATNATGATAPAGGGNGGNGKTTPTGAGTAGATPGGGGGGAYRSGGGGGQNGGAGSAGRVSITYTLPSFTITASAGTGGTITPSGAVSVAGGSNQSFSIVPNANNIVAGVSINGGASVGRVNNYTFTNVTANHTISATFDGGWSAPSAFSDPDTDVAGQANVYTSNNGYATIDSTNDEVNYQNFNLSIPSGATINGIEVAIEGYSTGTRNADVALSWNNGTSVTSYLTTTMPSTTAASEATVILGGPANPWGRTWSDTEFANGSFAVRVEGTSGGGSDLLIDQIQVKVHYAVPNTAPTVSTPIADVNVLEDAVNTVFSLYPNFQDAQDTDAQLTYTVTNNTNTGLFTSVNISDPTNFTLDYAPNANGTANITIRATDTGGLFVEDTFAVNVTAVNDAPSYGVSGPIPAVNEDAGSVSVPGWIFLFNPGPLETGQTVLNWLVSNSTCGTLLTTGPSVSGNTLSYTTAPNQNGTCTFDLQVQDNGGTANSGVDTSTATNYTITVNAVNDPSVANDDTPTVSEDSGTNTVNVRGNDTDIDSAVELIQSVTQPTNGTVVITNGGQDLTYAPNANYCNGGTPTDDFTYTLTGGDSATVAVTVTCADDPSVANDDTSTVWEDSGTNTITVRGNDSDIDSSVELIQSVTQPANGSVVITNGGQDLTYQPDAEYCNGGSPTDDFTYTLAGGASATVEVTVNCQTALTPNITASNKTYDGGMTASFTCALTPSVGGDDVSCSGGTASFADKNVGTGKTVTATGLGLSGADAFMYELASTSATDDADINARDLNVTAAGVNKVYDGNTNAAVTLSDDSIVTDDVTVDYTSASFADPNVGSNKPVTVTGISISGGVDAGNYSLVNTTANTTADITIASQTITITQNAPASAANGTTFDVAATASSGLSVTITTSGSCSGGDTDGDATITMTSGTGTCSVFYDQAGNSNYNPAPQLQEDVNATESPAFTSANNTSFDLGFAGSFNITATGNPQTMTISVSGTLPTGITLTDNGDGTATLSGTPAAGTAGVYNLILTANNGVVPNGIQNFTLTVRNGPTPTIVNSSPDTGNGSVSENESISTTLGLTDLMVEFSSDVYDPAGDTDPDDVTNPANYLLVRSATGTFATASCSGGVTAPDVAISVDSVTYNNGGGSGPFVATLSINSGLPLNVAGFYRLYVCGTTSIVDAANTALTLAGDGVNPGTDFVRNFRIAAPATGGGGDDDDNGNSNIAATIQQGGVLIPVTGFAPNRVTHLPAQTSAYSSSGLTVEVPSLSLKLPIVGVDFNGSSWDVTWLGRNAGYLEGSAYPTWSGNTVLTGHATDPNGKAGPFAFINELQPGQKIYIHNNGFTYVYEVRHSSLILPSNAKTLFQHEKDSWLSLVTCENFNEKTGTFTSRRLVRAVLISIIPTK